MSKKKAAYSYTRFSTPEQAEGDSKRRQDAMVAEWLKGHPEYELDTSLNLHDAGVSASKGKNAKVGKLAAFLKLVEKGEIAPGSVLLVEEWSRFSRQNPYDGAPVSRQIFDAGVGIMDLRSGTLYNAERLRTDMGLRIRLDVEWERSYREAEEKRIRRKSAWARAQEKARADGAPMTSICPAWLRPVLSGPDAKGKRSVVRFEVIEHRADGVRLIYAMAAAGDGTEKISRTLNADPNVWKPKEHFKNRRGGWWPPYVQKILKNPAVIGIYQSPAVKEPFESYFPPIIGSDLFYRVQAQRARKPPGHGSSNEKHAINNLFGGRTRCARCSGTMTVRPKGTPPHIGYYLVCDHARVGYCIKRPIRYDWLEPTLLHLTRDLEPAVAFTDETEAVRQGQARRDRRQKIQDDLDRLNQRQATLTKLQGFVETEASLQGLAAELDAIATQRTELEQELKKPATRIRSNRVKRVVDHHVTVAFLIERMKELEGSELRAVRQRLKNEIGRLLDVLEIEPGPHESKIVMHYRNGFKLHLIVDRRGTPTLYHFNDQLVDVDPHSSDTVAAERAERQRRLNRIVAKALQKQGVTPNMTW